MVDYVKGLTEAEIDDTSVFSLSIDAIMPSAS